VRKPVYRYYNGTDHFYTTNRSELGDGAAGYSLEGVAFYLEETPLDGNFKPFSRWYNSESGDHYYTADPNERPGGYNQEDPAMGYCIVSPPPGGLTSHVPLSRYWNGRDHFYTIDPSKEILDGISLKTSSNAYSKELEAACYVWGNEKDPSDTSRMHSEPVR
jgi:hypothetical protein